MDEVDAGFLFREAGAKVCSSIQRRTIAAKPSTSTGGSSWARFAAASATSVLTIAALARDSREFSARPPLRAPSDVAQGCSPAFAGAGLPPPGSALRRAAP
jgi:hypothetical protein